MKKLILALGLLFLSSSAWAVPTPIIIGDTVSAHNAVSITSNVNTQPRCRGVWVGTTQSLDFYFSDSATWVTFQGATAGTLLPIQASGARITSGTANPNAGDVVFLY